MQALINAGYVQPGEFTEGNKLEQPSKEFVATVLYRMFKEEHPYKGASFPADSTNEAVRWAVEIGLPGFTLDKAGKVHPEQTIDTDTMNAIFNFITLFLPGKKTNSGWEYYQLVDVRSLTTPFLTLNGKPYENRIMR